MLFFFALPVATPAHDPGLSAVDLQLGENRLDAYLSFAVSDVETANVNFQSLEAFAAGALEIRFDEKLVAAAGNVNVRRDDESGAVHFHLSFAREGASRLSLRSVVLILLPPGHRQHLSLRDTRGELLAARLLDARNNFFEASLATSPKSYESTFGQLFVLGVEHIITGYDHLVFLLGLLLVGHRFGTAAKIITSFTLAHSITLTLAALDVVQMPASVVEPLIAVSIVYVGLENILRRDPKRRWRLTFAFGLVHGFGFASVLQELGVGAGGGAVVLPLLSFNLGVEAGQTALAAVFLPLIWKLKNHRSFVRRYVPACSLLIALAGGYWLIERTLLP